MIDDFDFLQGDLTDALLFLKEAGKLKSVIRQTYLQNESRMENSAEHSWHLTLMALVLAPIADKSLNQAHIIKMLIIHDLGEVYHGDIFLYDAKRDVGKDDERNAVIELLALAPLSFQTEAITLWDEFEARQTAEAQFAQSIDRFQPFMEQLDNGGDSWLRHKISHTKALDKNKHIKEGFPLLWEYYQNLAQQAEDKGCFHQDENR